MFGTQSENGISKNKQVAILRRWLGVRHEIVPPRSRRLINRQRLNWDPKAQGPETPGAAGHQSDDAKTWETRKRRQAVLAGCCCSTSKHHETAAQSMSGISSQGCSLLLPNSGHQHGNSTLGLTDEADASGVISSPRSWAGRWSHVSSF
ncbi:hypothetical protein NM208_g14365 [Fusarium decemcellulare]|uniref:Uncharacterized protein n=1 Tax=Fusarium decemcellulare TaxID=57161 RepID=A0ACC1RHR9_9HYPO|nr:hypothetical protein NM208_g14365 [Fusarium decemcellulare]